MFRRFPVRLIRVKAGSVAPPSAAAAGPAAPSTPPTAAGANTLDKETIARNAETVATVASAVGYKMPNWAQGALNQLSNKQGTIPVNQGNSKLTNEKFEKEMREADLEQRRREQRQNQNSNFNRAQPQSTQFYLRLIIFALFCAIVVAVMVPDKEKRNKLLGEGGSWLVGYIMGSAFGINLS